MKKDSLGDRMKNNYESRAKIKLLRRTPVIIRLDGKAFHTFTKGMKRPYDSLLVDTMQQTMLELCKNIQGCKLGYTQSDEITLLLIDYTNLNTDAWFDYEVQKICSISSSMATLYFNKFFEENIKIYEGSQCDFKYLKIIKSKINKAMFDSRCFNIPKEEVCNCFIWRQQDATRNAIQMLGQSEFSHKELQGKSCNNIQDMLMIEKGINFNNIKTMFKRGCCAKIEDENWVVDKEIPIFTQNRNYIEDLI